MAPTATLPELVELTDASRTGKGLLTRALPLPVGWEQGIAFRSTGCVPPVLMGRCIAAGADGPEPVGDGVVFHPVVIRQSATCSSLSRVGPVDRANERLIGTTEWGLGRLLVEGIPGLDNPNLNDALSVSTAGTAVDALACLEQAIADTGYGNRAFIHVPYRGMPYLRDHYLVDDNDRTSSGHQVVASAGYPSGDTFVTMWATGPVWAAVGPVETFGPDVAANWRQNDDSAYTQRLALAAYDPCLLMSASFDVPACTGGS